MTGFQPLVQPVGVIPVVPGMVPQIIPRPMFQVIPQHPQHAPVQILHQRAQFDQQELLRQGIPHPRSQPKLRPQHQLQHQQNQQHKEHAKSNPFVPHQVCKNLKSFPKRLK